MSEHHHDEDTRERLWQVQSAVAEVNSEAADAVQQAAGLIDTRHPVMNLGSTHDELVDAYGELRRVIDRVEQSMDELDPDYGTSTPREIKSDHADRFEEIYDGPVLHVALLLVEQNRREWLHAKPETNGAEGVRRHGLTENQRTRLNELQDAWDAYEDGESDE